MSPLDDELRAALSRRAASVAPSPDPMRGIEQRAGRMRRNRALASVAGVVLAVSAIGVGVPLLRGDINRGAQVAVNPSGMPSGVPSVRRTATPGQPPQPSELAAGWEYRGDPAVARDLGPEVAAAWANRHAVDDVSFAPLFGQVYEPSGRSELVYLATIGSSEDGRSFWGVARSAPDASGPKAEIVTDDPVPADPVLFAAALPGDTAARLLVVADPSVTTLQYGCDNASEFLDMTPLAPGVAIQPLEGDPATDLIRAATPNGRDVYRGPAPDPVLPAPANALDWPARGTADPALEARAVAGFTAALGKKGQPVGHTVLYTGGNDAGQHFIVLQAWIGTGPAYSFGWIETPGRDPEPVLQPAIAKDERVVAILLTGIPGRTTDELVVVPARPSTVSYRATAGGSFTPVPGLPAGEGVVLIDRALGANADAVRLLSGVARTNDSEPFPVVAQVNVFDLLCGISGCG